MKNVAWVGLLAFAAGCGGECVNCAEPDAGAAGPGTLAPDDLRDAGAVRPDDPPDPGEPPDVEPPTEPEPPDDDGSTRGMAIFARDIPALSGQVDPATLFLLVGTSGAACDDPFGAVDCGEWQVMVPVPRERQARGTFALEEVLAAASSGGEPRSTAPGDCGFGAGSFYNGFITIHEIDNAAVSFTLEQTWGTDFDANGSYTAAVCSSSLR